MSTKAVARETTGHPTDRLAAVRPARPVRITVDARLVAASGIGTYLRNLLPRIMAARSGWHFDLLGRPAELAEYPWSKSGQVSVIPCDAPLYGLNEQLQLAWRIPRSTDLMWSPHYNIPLGYRGQLLVTIHDVCHLALPQLIRGAHRRAYARFMFAAVRSKATRILCDSEFTKREVIRLVGTPAREPVTAHLGIGEHWFKLQPTERPHSRPFVLFVGNVKPHKNLVTLVQAFESIAPVVPQDLVIVGKQEGFITADERVTQAAAGLGERIRFTGELPQAILEQFFLHADAFVFPSLYEGFGLPALEAMACGCPSIVSRAGSLPEICGDASLYFDPGSRQDLADTLLRVLSDEQLRSMLRTRGRSHAARFSWDQSAQTTLAVLEELVFG